MVRKITDEENMRMYYVQKRVVPILRKFGVVTKMLSTVFPGFSKGAVENLTLI